MKLVTYINQGEPNAGVVLNNFVVNISGVFDSFKGKSKIGDDIKIPNDMKSLLELGDSFMTNLNDLMDYIKTNVLPDEGEVKSLLERDVFAPYEKAEITAPILNPQKIVAIGLNYMDHCREQKMTPPESPVMFAKYPSTIIGDKDIITWSPELTNQVDFEAELGVIIGKKARSVPKESAFDYIAGYTCVNDVSARDLQFGDGQWVRGKSLDTFCPIGPWIVTKDEIPEPHNLSIKCIVNGTAYQDSNTREMIFKIPELISFITEAFTLLPGDVISTGTPDGVGVFRDPKVFLKSGDEVIVEIEKIGQLSNPVE